MKPPTRYTADYFRVIQDVEGDYVKFTDCTALAEENARLREALKACPAIGCESQILNEWWDSVAMPALAQTQDAAKGWVK